MTLSWTMQRYIATQLFAGIMIVFAGFAMLALMIDIAELLNRSQGKDVPTLAVIGMSLLKLPGLTEKILPFAVLFGSMLTFTKLSRTQELVVVRAAGMSIWQFLTPALGLAGLVGLLAITVYNPVAAAMMGRFEDLEARFIRGKPSLLSLVSTGLWLRQADESGQQVIHALRSGSQLQLEDVIVFLQDKSERFVGRIDAKSAQLSESEGKWLLSEAWVTGADRTPVFNREVSLHTTLTRAQIQDSFASPETVSFWELPYFIATFEEAGFTAVRHRLHYYALLASPFLLCAMTLIAASFSLRLARLGGVTRLILAGSLTGFLLYFLSDVTQALGISRILPVTLAAWSPTAVALLLGAATLLHLEDG